MTPNPGSFLSVSISMEIIGSIILALIFFLLAIIHFYWAMGGKWGFANSLPENGKGEKTLAPGPLACLVVGLGLLAFSLSYIFLVVDISLSLPYWLLSTWLWMIPVIFFLRAIGDFKYAGFFKRIRHTNFGKMDSRLYSPLCLLIGILGTLVQLA